MAAEQPPQLTEEFARSFSKIRSIGHAVVEQTVELDALPAYGQARADFTSAVRELARSDPEFNNVLDIDDARPHQIIDGKACDIDGEPMQAMIERGSKASAAMALVNTKYRGQAERDASDVYTINKVDTLMPGESYFAVSMFPKADLQAHPEVYESRLGYRDGLLYVQYYSKVDAATLVAGSCSIDVSDEVTWRIVLSEAGFDIPVGESYNSWIRHGLADKMDAEQARTFVHGLRSAYYRRKGMAAERFSISEFVGNNDGVVGEYFDHYYPALGQAVITRKNNPVIQELAQTLMAADLSKMQPEIRGHLVYLANGRAFSDEHAKAVDAVIHYAVVEELRKGLPKFMGQQAKSTPKQELVEGADRPVCGSMTFDSAVPPDIRYRVAANVAAGMAAGRAYGGCAIQIQMNDQESGELERIDGMTGNRQKAFGGNSKADAKEGVGEISLGSCEVPACPTRPSIVRVGGCGVCLDRCQILFDAGRDPTLEKVPPKPEDTFFGAMIVSLEAERAARAGVNDSESSSILAGQQAKTVRLQVA